MNENRKFYAFKNSKMALCLMININNGEVFDCLMESNILKKSFKKILKNSKVLIIHSTNILNSIGGENFEKK